MSAFVESEVEEAALGWLQELGYAVLHGPDIAPGELAAERVSYDEAFLPERLRQALAQLNPSLPAEALEEGFRKITRLDHPSLIGPMPSTGCSSTVSRSSAAPLPAKSAGRSSTWSTSTIPTRTTGWLSTSSP